MADLVAVMREGDLQQLASPDEVYDRPANRFVATFVGSPPMSVLDGAIDGDDFVVGDARLRARPDVARECREREAVAIGLRPEDLAPRRARHARRAAGIGVRGRADGLRDARRRHGRRDARDGAGAARDDLPARRGRRPRRRRAARLFLRRRWHDRRAATGHRALRLSARGDRRTGSWRTSTRTSGRCRGGGSSSRASRRAAWSPPAASWRPAAGRGGSSQRGRRRRPRRPAPVPGARAEGHRRGDHRRVRGRRARAVQERDLPAVQQGDGDQDQFLLEPYDSFFSKAFQDGTSKSGQFDIYIMDDPWIPQYAAGGVLEPLGAVRPDGGGRPTRRRSSTSGSGRRSRARA